jgi:hypothetical protein
MSEPLKNPFRPGAGQMPPYLAGRVAEEKEFRKLLAQDIILENLILTGLRGVGKTVLLEKFKPIAIQENWLWVGTDLSETASISETNLAIRIITDLSVVTSNLNLKLGEHQGTGFTSHSEPVIQSMSYAYLINMFDTSPGLVSDKLKTVLEFVWAIVAQTGRRGIIFAYDEAQNLSDHRQKEQMPLSILLEVFQSLQRKNIRFMLALVGLPTLFPKLVEARTYAERMFRVLSLSKLNNAESKEAIRRPVSDKKSNIIFSESSINIIAEMSGGYPYFIQFICREVFDLWIQKIIQNEQSLSVPKNEIIQKLDTDFFSGRWVRATDRQRVLLKIIANLENCDGEFSVQEIVNESLKSKDKFSSSHINQMLVALSNNGLVYKNRHGKYSFAVPLMAGFIKRQIIE